MLKRYCDICGKEIGALEDYAIVSAKVHREGLGKGNMKKAVNIYNNELCEDCYRKFYDMYLFYKAERRGYTDNVL